MQRLARHLDISLTFEPSLPVRVLTDGRRAIAADPDDAAYAIACALLHDVPHAPSARDSLAEIVALQFSK